jgi:hypothetical protein
MEVLKIIGVFLLLNIGVYLIGSFIAWNLNPLQWWAFKDTFGRILFLCMELFLIAASVKHDDL